MVKKSKGRKKLPEDPRRKDQVRTYIQRHGRQGYSKAGKLGGGAASPGSFTSDRARAAALKRWGKTPQPEAARKGKNNENGLPTNQEN